MALIVMKIPQHVQVWSVQQLLSRLVHIVGIIVPEEQVS